jgi:hypothetical protein
LPITQVSPITTPVLRAGVDVDPGAAVGLLGHHAPHHRLVDLVEGVGDPVRRDGSRGRVGLDDLAVAVGGRVAVEGGLHVHLDAVPDVGQLLDQLRGLVHAHQTRHLPVRHVQVGGQLAVLGLVEEQRPQPIQGAVHLVDVEALLAAGRADRVALFALRLEMLRHAIDRAAHRDVSCPLPTQTDVESHPPGQADARPPEDLR